MSEERDLALGQRDEDGEDLAARASSGPGQPPPDAELASWAPSLLPARTGRAAVPPAGDREVHRPATTVGRPASARHNWVPIGPRNVAGRMRAIVCGEDPAGADPQLWFAGSAGGGVWRSTDGGRRWEPLPGWHRQRSLCVAAMAVAPSDRRFVYAATGESRPGSFIGMRGVGVVVSEDGGRTWTNHAVGAGQNPVHVGGFDAVAVHPTTPTHAWAVGLDGAFRTLDGGRTWDRISPAHHTDAVFTPAGALFLVPGRGGGAEGAVLRLDDPGNPSAATVTAALSHPDARSVVLAARGLRRAWPSGGKLAISPGSPARAYVRLVDEEGRHAGVFRSLDATAARGRDLTWTRLPEHADWPAEGQGMYCLCIAVASTGGHDTVVTGMVLLHAATDAEGPAAGVRFHRVMHWGLHSEGLRAHHADNHHLTVAGNPGFVWLANDGGIARAPVASLAATVEPDGTRPLGRGAPVWERRDAGISGAQAYDLEQSPHSSTALAVGLQDHGTYLRSGGLSWRPVFGGDGGFAAFDPDDPYRLEIGFYAGMFSLQYPGLLDAHFPDDARGAEPAVGRLLAAGLADDPPFVPPTSRDGRDSGRAFHARRGRLYSLSTARGELFVTEPVGRSFALWVRPAVAATAVPDPPRPLRSSQAMPPEPRVDVEVADTAGARALGLVPGRSVTYEHLDGLVTDRLTLFSRLAAPYRVGDGDEVRITLDGTVHTARFTAADVADLAAVTVGEVLSRLGTLGGDRLVPVASLWNVPTAITLVTRGSGPGRSLRLGGDALDALPDGLSRLGLNPGAYPGDTGRPASVILAHVGADDAAREVNRDFSAGAATLEVTVDGGTTRRVRLDGPTFPDRSRIGTGRLAAALRTALADDPVDVVEGPLDSWVQLVSEAGTRVLLSGTLADHLSLPPAGAPLVRLGPRTRESVHLGRQVRNAAGTLDLRPAAAAPPLELVVSDGTNATPPMPVRPTDVVSLRAVTPEELCTLLRRHLAANPAVRVGADLVVAPTEGWAKEPTFSPAVPGVAWVASRDGGLHRTRDGGARWADVTDLRMRLADLDVEAVVAHPTDPSTAYVGLAGEARPVAAVGSATPAEVAGGQAATVFRTADGGAHWTALGLPGADGTGGVAVDGLVLGVNALVLDPADDAVLLAATDAGVFRSPDRGLTWAPVNEGLPNAPVVDLAVDRERRLLRACLWSRGVWERRLDDGPPDDVRLVIRATEADDGHRPARRAPSFGTAAAGPVTPGSPDLRVVRRRPAALGPDPTADEHVDGVLVDLALDDDELVAGTAAHVVVQVSNYGPTPVPVGSPPAPAERARVVLLLAEVDAGPPLLPGDLWARIRAGTLPAGAMGAWTVLGDGAVPRTIGPGDTGVLSLPVAWPALVGVRRVGLLALVTAPADPLLTGPPDVETLVARERRTAYRELPVTGLPADRTLQLRTTDGRAFSLAAPPAAEARTAHTALGFVAGDLGGAGVLVRTAPTAAGDEVALPTADPGPGLVVRSGTPQAAALLLTPEPGEVASPTAVTPGGVAGIISARARAAGVPVEATTTDVGLRLRCRGGVLVRCSGPAAPVLGLTVGGPGAPQRDSATTGSFALAGAASLTLTLVLPAGGTLPVLVDLSAPRLGGRTTVRARDVVRAVVEDLRAAGAEPLLLCHTVSALVVLTPGTTTMTLGGTAAAPLGLTPGTGDWFVGGTTPVDLTAGPVLDVAVTRHVLVRFDADPSQIPDPARARHADVRRTITRACALADVPVVAGTPTVDLRVADSTAGPGRHDPVLGDAHLAELAVTTAAVAAAGRPGLLQVRPAIRPDRLVVGGPNFLYVRVRNLGTADAADTQVRVFHLVETGVTVTATQVAVTAPGAAAVAGPGVAVPELGWAAAGVTAGSHLLLVVVDRVAAPVAVPAAFADLGQVRLFARRPDAALRRIDVGP
ncbi:hypothetical protein [Jannaschia sp. R86511]|uniref:hypothetical protein n=1 Tax=Jannaschia sp. R86511 TaxID=3093853 RepID=UPI0036D3387C